MPHSHGYRRGTRYTFQRKFRQSGTIPTSTYLHTYRLGDYVDIKVNGAVHKGMPHKYYQGRTGVVWNVTPNAVGLEINKRVRHRIIKKRIHVRIEHVVKSKCRDEFIKRVRANQRKVAAAKKLAVERKEKGSKEKIHLQLKRLPAQPREGVIIKIKPNHVKTITPLKFEDLI